MQQRQEKRSDLASSSQFLMIAVVMAIVLVILAAWHPWSTRQVNGVHRTDVATSHP